MLNIKYRVLGAIIMNLLDRYKGALMGLAVGDALGCTLEFRPPGSFVLLTDMVGGGPDNLPPGAWTDDTSACLLLSESLIQNDGFDLQDQLNRYLAWYRKGYLSSTGYCFGIGKTTQESIERFEKYQTLIASDNTSKSGNGSIMRLAAVPLFYARSPRIALLKSAESSLTTHGSKECVDSCHYFGALIVSAIQGKSKDDILSPNNEIIYSIKSLSDFHPSVIPVINGSYKLKSPPDIKGTGYVIQSLEAALWAFYNSKNFEEGVLKAANLGDDADTTGAVFGQLAGAYYGYQAIPKKWCDKIVFKEKILKYAERLHEKAWNQPNIHD